MPQQVDNSVLVWGVSCKNIS